jgi:hypothetical protein
MIVGKKRMRISLVAVVGYINRLRVAKSSGREAHETRE